MSDSSPIPPVDPYEKIKIHRIEEKKVEQRQKEESANKKTSSKKPRAIMYYYVLKKFLQLFPKAFTVESKESIKKSLAKIEKLFLLLAKENVYEDNKYLQNLSSAWAEFFENFSPYALQKNPFIKKTQVFIKSINSYPESQSFSLQYYLSQYSGFQWTPFPFIEMLKNIHLEHQKSPQSSMLQKWISQIEECIHCDES